MGVPAMSAKKNAPSSRRKARSTGFYTPFEGLDQQLAAKQKKKESSAVRSPSVSVRPPQRNRFSNDEELFLQAVSDVVPLSDRERSRVPVRNPGGAFPRYARKEDLEVLAHLVDLVNGECRFELTLSDEYVDGAVVGLAPSILRGLRKGDYSYQDHVDLHGLTRVEAHEEVIRFIQRSHARGLRCVLVVCGRGRNSRGKEPVLKTALIRWFTQAPLKKVVLAFATARSWDGGFGAFYVLLRRGKGKSPVRTPAP